MTALWIDQNGRVACPDHGGHYLRDAVDAVPYGARIFTPLGDWMRIPYDVAAEHTCEDC